MVYTDKNRERVRRFITNMGYGDKLRKGMPDSELEAIAEMIARHNHS